MFGSRAIRLYRILRFFSKALNLRSRLTWTQLEIWWFQIIDRKNRCCATRGCSLPARLLPHPVTVYLTQDIAQSCFDNNNWSK